MRQGPSNRRVRSRGNNTGRRSNLPNRNQTFDSNGPDVRIRGTAVQVNEKYLALARDATTSGDRVMAESYFQHAEHYHRIIASINESHSQAQQTEVVNRQRDDGPRDYAQRDGGNRENESRQSEGRQGENRQGENRQSDSRQSGNRENVHRDNAHRDNGRQLDRDVAAKPAVSGEPRPNDQPEMEFGKDPRQDDVRDTPLDLTNGEAVIEVIGVSPIVAPESEPAEKPAAGNGKAAAKTADAGDGDAPAPKPKRRGPGRPRKTAAQKEAATVAPKESTEGG